MIEKIKRFIPKKIRTMVRGNKNDSFSIKSYSQRGEDILLRQYFEKSDIGFYVDVGAHHPIRFSNTYYFYQKGWKGINIDAMPGSMKLFNKIRPRDINLEMAISDKNERLTYFAFNDSALNTFSKELSLKRIRETNYKIIFTKEIETRPLSEVLDKFLPKKQKINFLSIDVEGLDFNVLKSNNWKKYVPEVILVEILGLDFRNLRKNEIYYFLEEKGYEIYSKIVDTIIFKHSE
ncbi:MAG: FkbM family methyltransferase [Candidatus Helarchaeota archaeon]